MTYSIKFKFKFIRPFLIRAKGSKGTACRCAHPPSAGLAAAPRPPAAPSTRE